MGFFDGGGPKGASFDAEKGFPLGTAWSGFITAVRPERQVREYIDGTKPGPLKFYPDSNDPIMELPVEFEADQIQKTDEDDGIRLICFDGEKRKAMGAALREAGVRRDPRPGDWFSLQWTNNGGKTGRKKLYTAQFVPDARPVQPQGQQFFAGQSTAPAPVAPPAPAAPQPPVAPPAPAAPVAQAAQVAAALQQAAAPVAPPAPPVAPQVPQQAAQPPWAPAPVAPQPVPVGAAPASSEEPPW